jgi:hypothetical protein
MARAIDVTPILHIAGLYIFLVIYEFATLFMLQSLLSTRFGYAGISYATDRFDTYFWVCLLTPLAVLPAGTRLRTPAQFMFPPLAALIMLTTPIFLVANVSTEAFWSLYICIMIAMTMLALATRLEFKKFIPPLSVPTYRRWIWGLIAFFVVFLLLGARENFRFVGLLDIYAARDSSEYASDFTIRVVHMYVFSFGGLLAGIAFLKKRYLLFAIALLGFIFCFAVTQLKSAILGPGWLLYVLLSVRYFAKGSTWRFYLALTFPFFVGIALRLLFPEVQGFADNWPVFGYFAFISFRFYGVSNEALGMYYSFFSTHPHTYWSHINGINWFVHYPYGSQQISEVMNGEYGTGNFNAGFMASDAIGAYSFEAIPLVTLLMVLVYMIMNSAGRRIERSVLAMMMVMPALMFNERAFSTSLLTGGIIFLFFYLAWFPEEWRQASDAT